MKKMILFGLMLAAAGSFATDLKTLDGTVYHNVSIVSADPERMLIVHDGGGIQVAYENLGPGALTPEQQKAVEQGIKDHLERQVRLEALRLEREKFAQEQRDKGLIEFEGEWMKPEERREIMALREMAELDREREEIALEKERAQLERERLATERERVRLEESRARSRSYSTYTYVYPYRSYRDCDTVRSSHHHSNWGDYNNTSHRYFRTPRVNLGLDYVNDGVSISVHGGRSKNWP